MLSTVCFFMALLYFISRNTSTLFYLYSSRLCVVLILSTVCFYGMKNLIKTEREFETKHYTFDKKNLI